MQKTVPSFQKPKYISFFKQKFSTKDKIAVGVMTVA
jgi:hypothetical protein